ETPGHIGILIGKVISVESRNGYMFAEISSKHDIKKGDGLKIMRNNIECGGADVTSVTRKGNNYVVPVSIGVSIGDEVRLTTDIAQLLRINKQRKQLKINIFFQINKGKALLTAKYNNISVSCESALDIVERSLANEQITEQLSKTNDTPFLVDSISIDNNGGYLAKSALNGMRREALIHLEKAIIEAYRREEYYGNPYNQYTPKLHVKLNTRLIEIQYKAQIINNIQAEDVIIINPIEFNMKSIGKLVAEAEKLCKNIYIKMPRLNRSGEYSDILEFAKVNNLGLLADNAYVVQFARENRLNYIAGMGLNIYNALTFDYYGDAEYIIISPEIGNSALLERGGVLFAAGYLPLMTLAHCPHALVYDTKCLCATRGRTLYYKDGANRFAVVPTVAKSCQFTMYN
ncbi:MAG: DUF3656 domain-containing protein, partial [Clostridia bacterium]|nr:DUF3656 domain-containing protein [Clostridia bacterium]